MLELAEIFRRYGPAYRTKFADRMLPSHLAAMAAIAQCRPDALGGHLSPCAACGARESRAHSWKNRHGPQCQHDAATRWLAQQRTLLLPVPYFLVTFTLPEALRPVARAHQHCLSNLLLQTSAAALQALTLDPYYLGGPIGMVGVLHTWTRDLASHPHVHYRVPGGPVPSKCAVALTPFCSLARARPRALPALPGSVQSSADHRWPQRFRATPSVAQGLGDPRPTGGHRYRGPHLLRPLHLPDCPDQPPPGNV